MAMGASVYCSGVILWKAQVTERVGMVLRDASAFCCRAACKTCKDGDGPKTVDCQNKTFLSYADNLTAVAMHRVLKQWQVRRICAARC